MSAATGETGNDNGTKASGGAGSAIAAESINVGRYIPIVSTPFNAARPSREMLERLAAFEARRIVPTPRWDPVRAIVMNYFVIQYQEFYFVNGCLVLGGGNGVGKTSILTALLTLTLDNDKHPHRLDPSGSRDRSIAYYVLGDKPEKQFYHRDRTGYLAWEFRHSRTGEYRTIGIGLRGTRASSDGHPNVDSWGFVIGDGRRIGIDFQMYEEDGKKKIPFSRTQLEQRLGCKTGPSPNKVVEGVSEYQELVNDALFRFPDIQLFRDLLKTLTELRASKLDNNIKPSTVCRMLQESLLPIDQSLLEEAGRLYERIDGIRDRLDEVEQEIAVVVDLDAAERAWRLAAAQREAALFRDAAAKAEAAARRLRKLKGDIAREERTLETVTAELEDNRKRQAKATGRLETLRRRDEVRGLGELQEREARVVALEKHIARSREAHMASERRLADALGQAGRLLADWQQEVGTLVSCADEIVAAACAGSADAWPTVESFGRGVASAGRVVRDLGAPSAVRVPIPLYVVRADYEVRRDGLHVLRAALQRIDAAMQKLTLEQRRYEDAEDELREATGCLEGARQEEQQNRVRSVEGVREWAASIAADVPFDPVMLDAVGEEILSGEVDDPLASLAPLHHAVDVARTEAHSIQQAALERKAEVERDLATVRSELARAERELEATPTLTPAQSRARAVLSAGGVTAVPLYAAVDFRSEVAAADAMRIEQLLTETSLLNALVVTAEDCGEAGRLVGSGAPGTADLWLSSATASAAASTVPTLADYLEPVACAVPEADIVAVLRAVAVRPEGEVAAAAPAAGALAAELGLDGTWRQGVLVGRAAVSAEVSVRYIGALNRERTRQQTIARLEDEVRTLEDALSAVEGTLLTIGERLARMRAAERALAALPALKALGQAMTRVVVAERDVERREEKVSSAQRLVADRRGALAEARRESDAHFDTLGWSIPRTLSTVEQALTSLDRLLPRAEEIERSLQTTARLAGDHSAATSRVEAERGRVREDAQAVRDVEVEMEEARARLAAVRQLLAREDVKAILSEINELEFSLRNLAEVIDERKTQQTSAETRLSEWTAALPERDGEAEAAARDAADAREQLLAVLDAHASLMAEAAQIRAGADLAAAALERLLADVGGAQANAAKLELLRDQAFDRAEAVRRDHYVLLTRLQPAADRANGYTFVYEGRQVTTVVLLAELRQELHRLTEALDDEQESLMQKFINTELLSAIRAAVDRTNALVNVVNAKLKPLKTSKGRQLRFRWEPVQVAGMTTNFATIAPKLQVKATHLSEEDRAAVVAFIQERLAYVRSSVKKGDAPLGYVEALRQALDYRNWHQFTMEAREGTHWASFTDHKFGSGSNGEKAVDMLSPLFAVVHARYAGAAPDAPRLLGMDEAFAGVDATNTKAMFKLLTDFELSWLMTSEKLWGVSDELPGCATYQLVVDSGEDPSMLAATFFFWDGKRRVADRTRTTANVATTGDGGPQRELSI